MQFQPGQSGNPNGRPAVARDFRERCQQFMQTKGWRQLEHLATDPEHQHHGRALELIAAYAYGKPTQPIEQSGMLTVEHLDSSTVDQALEYAARRRGLRAVS
jgi:hypothetical protein